MSVTKFHHGQILHGDVLEKLKEIPAESIDCVITSPPYWGLRDYKVDGQWGLEKDFHDYLKKMQDFMDLLRVVMKKTATCWVNLGDGYGTHRSNEDQKMRAEKQERETIQQYEKSRMGIPERFYTQCIDKGWIARNHIPWIKENAMPQSTQDRLSNKWESIFFFAISNEDCCWKHTKTNDWYWKKPIIDYFNEEKKDVEWEWKEFIRRDSKIGEDVWFYRRMSLYKSFDYFFDLDKIRIQAKATSDQTPFNRRVREAKRGYGEKKMGTLPGAFKMSGWEDKQYDVRGFRKQDHTLGADGKPLANYKGFNEKWKNRKYTDTEALNVKQIPSMSNRIQDGRDKGVDHEVGLGIPKGFDEKGKCFGCGEHYSKHVNSRKNNQSYLRDTDNVWDYVPCNPKGKNPGDVIKINPRPFPKAHFATFPPELPTLILKCACPKGGVVLDPFFGAGTVGLAAEQLGLDWVGNRT